MNDRQLRFVTDGLGGRVNGVPREDGYDITVASEIMAVLCLASDIIDLKERLARIVVAYTYDDKPVTAGELKAQGAMAAFVEILPEWLTHGFEVAGGILPAVGFAMLLKAMLKGEFVPYLLIGFVIACFLDFSNLLPIAIIGVALALIAYNNENKVAANTVAVEEFDDGI